MNKVVPWVIAPKFTKEYVTMVNRAWIELRSIFPRSATYSQLITNYLVLARGKVDNVMHHPPSGVIYDRHNEVTIVIVRLIEAIFVMSEPTFETDSMVEFEASNSEALAYGLTWIVLGLRELVHQRQSNKECEMAKLDDQLIYRCYRWAIRYIKRHRLKYMFKIILTVLNRGIPIPIGISDVDPVVVFT